MSLAVPSWDFPRSPFGILVVVEMGEERGLAAADALALTGLERSDLTRSDLQVGAGQELAVIRNVLRALGDEPGLGAQAGVKMTLGMLGSWGFAMLNSRTVRDAIDVALRYGYGHFSFVFAQPRVEERSNELRIVLDVDELPLDVRSFVIERDLSAQVSLIPKLLGPAVTVRIETTLDQGRGAALRRALAPHDVTVGCGRDAMILPRGVLDRSLPHADEHAVQRWRKECDALLERHVRSGLRAGVAATVRATLLRRPDGMPSLPEVADGLYMSPRTLRRKLEAEGTSYRAIVDEVRAELAHELLADGEPVGDVARRLGYAESASFIRAHKRWTGATPTRLAEKVN